MTLALRRTLLIVGLLAILGLTTTVQAFSDVPENHPYYPSINYVVEQGFMSGKADRFNPSTPVGRYDFFTAILKNLYPNYKESDTKLLFTDLGIRPPLYLQKAVETGLIENQRSAFYPDLFINRRDALIDIFRVRKINIDQEDSATRFLDVPDGELGQIVNRCVNINLLLPINENFFGFNRPLTRGELAQIIFILDNKDALSDNGMDPTTIDLSEAATNNEELFRLKLWSEVYQIINEEYLHNDKIDRNKLIYESLKGMVSALDDKYSEFWDPTTATEQTASLEGEIEGIGAFIAKTKDDKYLEIVAPIDNSPAAKAGLLPGDIITKVNNEDLEGLSLNDATAKVKGPKGTTVHLTIIRQGAIMQFDIVRDKVRIVDVKWEDKGNGVYYIRITQFTTNTSDAFNSAVTEIKQNGQVHGVVLDLRNNAGGLLDAAETVLSNFIPEQKPLLYVEYNNGEEVIPALKNQALVDIPVIVLVNKGSASASEIVAGALQDYKIAKLLGETTYGKGVVQEIISFIDGSALKITTAAWLTPLKHTIDKTGLTADIQLVDDESTERDEALDKALEILR